MGRGYGGDVAVLRRSVRRSGGGRPGVRAWGGDRHTHATGEDSTDGQHSASIGCHGIRVKSVDPACRTVARKARKNARDPAAHRFSMSKICVPRTQIPGKEYSSGWTIWGYPEIVPPLEFRPRRRNIERSQSDWHQTRRSGSHWWAGVIFAPRSLAPLRQRRSRGAAMERAARPRGVDRWPADCLLRERVSHLTRFERLARAVRR